MIHYRIYRDGVEIAYTSGNDWFDSGLDPHTPYLYTVEAVDATGTASATTATLQVTTSLDAAGDPDGDGVPNVTDCAPFSTGVWADPGPVDDSLRLSGAGVTVFTWSRGVQGHTSNLYRGSVTGGPGWPNNEICLVGKTRG